MALIGDSKNTNADSAYASRAWCCDRCYLTASTRGRSGSVPRLPRGWSKRGEKTFCPACEQHHREVVEYVEGWRQRRDERLRDLRARAVRHAC